MPRAKSPGRPFQPGKSGNPSGRPRIPEVLRVVTPLTTDEVKRAISKHFRMTRDELHEVINDPQAQSLDLLIANTIEHAIDAGDIYKAEYLFLRTLGKVTEKVEVQHPEPVIIERMSGDVVHLGVREIEH